MDPHEEDELKKLFPFAKSWRSLYIFVLAELAGLILLFYYLSGVFS